MAKMTIITKYLMVFTTS